MKRKKTREERINEFRATDANFRRLYDRVYELNGGRIPSSQEIGQRLEARIARGRAAGY
jgi:hypothetical protein